MKNGSHDEIEKLALLDFDIAAQATYFVQEFQRA